MKIMGVLFCFILILGMVGGCSNDDVNSVTRPADEIKAEGDDAAGNNLSFPVIWSDGYDLPLRGTFGVESFAGDFTEVESVPIYHQQDLLNEWQAESAFWSGPDPMAVDWVDWGDNLESKSWPERSKIRVETVLFQDLTTPMVGYEMIWVSGLGVDEMWGSNTLTYEAAQATVYSHCARLTIQKLPNDLETPLEWDRGLHQWVLQDGGVAYNDPVWNAAVYGGGEGPDNGYSAEINIKGKVIYGMLWDTRQDLDGPGWYRMTFSFDEEGGAYAPMARFDEFSQVMLPVEEEEKEEPAGNAAVIDVDRNLTYIDVQITERGGGRGGDRDNPPGGGGGGGGGGH